MGTCPNCTSVGSNRAHEQDDAFAFLSKPRQEGPSEINRPEEVRFECLPQSGGAMRERALVSVRKKRWSVKEWELCTRALQRGRLRCILRC